MKRERRDPTSVAAPHAISDLELESQDAFGATDRSLPTEIPRPHVEFPATIQLDAQSRRHTRIASEFPVELAVDTPVNTPIGTPERRPLSEFAHRAIDPGFRPLFEVDGFIWPDMCRQILEIAGDALNSLAKHVLITTEAGHSVVGMTADQSGTGCTTILLCLARQLAMLGARVALVDASFTHPALGERLGLAIEHGWDHVLRGQVPLAEAMIASQKDRMVLLPLASPMDPEMESDVIWNIQAAIGIGVLREHYDVTLMDLGSMDSSVDTQPAADASARDMLAHGRPVDGILKVVQFAVQTRVDRLLATYHWTDPARRNGPSIEEQFLAAGIPPLGVIENFAVP
ncbi:MAG: hypothetical protein JW829_21045 [Pirellulales bacterium]|nr:hypothetical protein [Pirellulales bacterium]